eukprot:TRINITY_DN29148_c0_g1_i1.p2 TRINITY_DN29148_c0_g1~~TRINITY_DN29148_c0_g1_i1.p2  ORF type:complete len:186 (+),score=45.26 TRINITY_DN29148_c0_g1_i1:118-675(+)
MCIRDRYQRRVHGRKKNFIEKGAKGHKRKEQKAADSPPEDWNDYLLAYHKILRCNCEAAKNHFTLRAPDQFEQELKKVWFGYLHKWKASGVRLQGGFMEARKGCFKMALPGKLSKRFILSNEPTVALSEEAINLENSTNYRKIVDEQYNTLKSEFYKEKASHRSCLLYTSPSPRDLSTSRMPSSA